MNAAHAVHDALDRRRLGDDVAVVFEVDRVHQSRERREFRIAEPETADQHFERAFRPLMAELHAIHVERAARGCSRCAVSASAEKTMRAFGLMKRRISQAQAKRSMPGRGRVTQVRAR